MLKRTVNFSENTTIFFRKATQRNNYFKFSKSIEFELSDTKLTILKVMRDQMMKLDSDK